MKAVKVSLHYKTNWHKWCRNFSRREGGSTSQNGFFCFFGCYLCYCLSPVKYFIARASLWLSIVSGVDVFSLPLAGKKHSSNSKFTQLCAILHIAYDKTLVHLLLELRTLLRIMMPSWVCSLVVMSNMWPPSPGTMVYSTSAFLPMSKSWALILPTADPTAEDSGTRRWKKPGNTHISGWRQAHLLSALDLWSQASSAPAEEHQIRGVASL